MAWYLQVNDKGFSCATVAMKKNKKTGQFEEFHPVHDKQFGPYATYPQEGFIRPQIKATILALIEAGDKTVFSLPLNEVLEEKPKTEFEKFFEQYAREDLLAALQDASKHAELKQASRLAAEEVAERDRVRD